MSAAKVRSTGTVASKSLPLSAMSERERIVASRREQDAE